jgi:GT2 family glycosyltransferase
MNEIPDILLFSHRLGEWHERQLASIAKRTPCSYTLIYDRNPKINAHQAAAACWKRATSRYVALCDDDCLFLTDNWITILIDLLKHHESFGAIAPMEVKRVHDMQNYLSDPLSIRLLPSPPRSLISVPWAATYCLVVDRERVPDIVIDENMPGKVAMVDVDVGLQIMHAGYEVGMTDAAVVLHSEATRRDSDQRRTVYEEQKLHMFKKWGDFFLANFRQRILRVIELG